MKKVYYIVLASLFSTLLLNIISCKKVLNDKVPESTYTSTLLFSDSVVAVQYINSIYTANLPGWAGNGGSLSTISTTGVGNLTEESYSSNTFTLGTVTTSTVGDLGSANANNNNYAKIRNINDFISNLPASPIPVATKNRFKAQALFWRAYRYFDLVRLYGGVPLVLTPLPVVGTAAKQADELPRNTTTQTFNQIVADLDTAIVYLPNNWPGQDYGRITRGAAQAFLGRVLLTWASPQFNVNSDATRWQAAYTASTNAIATLTASGYGLYPTWDVTMWTTQGGTSTGAAIAKPVNPEAVMVTEYNTLNDQNLGFNNTLTESNTPKSLGGAGSNAPTWNEVIAFPMADGKVPNLTGSTPNASTKYPWDPVHFYDNRDPRFAQTIAYNGCLWPLQGNATNRLWTYFYYTSSSKTTTTETGGSSSTGFYCRKAVDPNLSLANLPYSGINWQEIRYAEVLLNQAEAAAMIGNSTVAYNDLIAIRKRAGIQAGTDNMYGLTTGLTGTSLAMAVLYERQIELAYEGKRYWDLRRWKLLESTLNGIKREGLTIVLKPNSSSYTDYLAATRNNLVTTSGLDAIYTQYFSYSPVSVGSGSTLGELFYLDATPIAYQPADYFFGITPNSIISDPNLQQNNTWGGPFDPTQ
ncbi:RagB/SusD family nutrient uptake outer membrane protein [Mucilaginibacter sp.]